MPSPSPVENTTDGGDMGELPSAFHKRLGQLLGAFPGATLASVRTGKQPGSWAVELRFGDRQETFVVIYAPDQVVV